MTLSKMIEYRKEFTEYVERLRFNSDKKELENLSAIRHFSVDLLDRLGVFYIGKEAEMLLPDSNGKIDIEKYRKFGIISPTNNRPIYSDRFIIPLYDLNGYIMALVGYSLTSKQRYIYSNTEYFFRNDILYNLQVYEKCIKDGYVIVTEGITDCIRLLNMGFKNVMSTAGAHRSLWMMQMLDNIENVIFIPDRDRAGDGTKEYWITHNYTRLLIPFYCKDLDEFAVRGDKEELILKYFIKVAIEHMATKKNKKGEELPIMFDSQDTEWLEYIAEEVKDIKYIAQR